MRNIILNSVLTFVCLVIVSCNLTDNPVNPAFSPLVVQTEEKWESDILTSNKLHKIYYKEFDKNGQVLLYVEFSSNSDTTAKSLYTYEDNISTEQHITYDQSGEVVENSRIKYFFSESKLVEKKKYDVSGELQASWTFDYNSQGHLIKTEQEDFVSGTSLVKTIKNEYNISGELTEISYEINETSSHNPDIVTHSKDSIVYLDNNSVKFYKIDDEGKVNNVYSYIYSNTGQITAEIVSDDNGNLKNRYDYYYSYFK